MHYMRKKEISEGVEIFGGYFLNSYGQAEAQRKAIKKAELNRQSKKIQIELSKEEIDIIEKLSQNDE